MTDAANPSLDTLFEAVRVLHRIATSDFARGQQPRVRFIKEPTHRQRVRKREEIGDSRVPTAECHPTIEERFHIRVPRVLQSVPCVPSSGGTKSSSASDPVAPWCPAGRSDGCLDRVVVARSGHLLDDGPEKNEPVIAVLELRAGFERDSERTATLQRLCQMIGSDSSKTDSCKKLMACVKNMDAFGMRSKYRGQTPSLRDSVYNSFTLSFAGGGLSPYFRPEFPTTKVA